MAMSILGLFSTTLLAIYACVAQVHGGHHTRIASSKLKLKHKPKTLVAPVSAPWLAPVPGPSSSEYECAEAIYDMLPCYDYLKKGSTVVSKPPDICCHSLEALLRTNIDCVCESIEKSDSIGFSLNLKRVVDLPYVCKASSAPQLHCDFPLPPANQPDESQPAPPPSMLDSSILFPPKAPTPSAATTLTNASDLCLALVLSLLLSILY